MKLNKVAATLLLAGGPALSLEIGTLTTQALSNLEAQFTNNGQSNVDTCTPENAAVRREWFVL